MIFNWGKGKISYFFGERPTKWFIAKKKKTKTIKTFVPCNAP
jgi:hypothetical protein